MFGLTGNFGCLCSEFPQQGILSSIISPAVTLVVEEAL